MLSTLRMVDGAASRGGAVLKAHSRTESNDSDRGAQHASSVSLKECEKESVLRWLSIDTKTGSFDDANSSGGGASDTSARGLSSDEGSDGGVMVQDVMALLRGVISCGVSSETAGQLVANYYMAMDTERKCQQTPTPSQVSQTSSAVRKRQRLERWNAEVSALTIPDGQCYLRAVRFSRRRSFLAAVGKFPTLQAFVAELREGDLDVSAARQLGFYRIGGPTRLPVQYHVSADHCIGDVLVGSVYDVVASTLHRFPSLNAHGYKCVEYELLPMLAFGTLGGMDTSVTQAGASTHLEPVYGNLERARDVECALHAALGGAGVDGYSLPTTVGVMSESCGITQSVDVVLGVAYAYAGTAVLVACGRRVVLSSNTGFLIPRASQRWFLSDVSEDFGMFRVVDMSLTRHLRAALTTGGQHTGDLDIVSSVVHDGLPFVDDGMIPEGTRHMRFAGGSQRLHVVSGMCVIAGVFVQAGQSVAVPASCTVTVLCSSQVQYRTEARRSGYARKIPVGTLRTVEEYGSGRSYLRVFSRADWSRASADLGVSPTVTELGHALLKHGYHRLADCVFERVDRSFVVRYATRSGSSTSADLLLPVWMGSHPDIRVADLL